VPENALSTVLPESSLETRRNAMRARIGSFVAATILSTAVAAGATFVPEDMLWTTVGSVGVTNGSTVGRIRMAAEAASTEQTGVNGEVTLRYNVTAVPGLLPYGTLSSNAFWGLRVRLRDDSDATYERCIAGSCVTVKHGVTLRLRKMSLATGAVKNLITLNSNSIAAASGSRTIESPTGHLCSDLSRFEFDFTKNAYFIEATFYPAPRTTALKLHGIQIIDTHCSPVA